MCTLYVFGEVLKLLGHGSAEQQSLPLLGEVGHDRLHFFVEAHVQHPVGLVQAQIPVNWCASLKY
jgi:hypothetical protein